MKQYKLGIAFLLIGILLIAAALLLVVHNIREAHHAKEAAGIVLKEMKQAHLEENGKNQTPAATEANIGIAEEEKTMPVMEIDGYEYIGYLSIPAIQLELPVMSDWDDARLKIAPCRQYGTMDGNDFVIAGHNYISHFGALKKLSANDFVYFTDVENHCTVYQVAATEILEPEQIEEMKNSPWELTLYTCSMDGAHRVTIRCMKTQ